MFDIGLQEMLVIGVLALLVFGPSRLPELGRMFGRAMREFRKASDDFRSTVETNLRINEPDPIIAPSPPEVTAGPAPSAEPAALPSELEGLAAEPGAPPTESGEPFCAQRGSRLFHRRECAWVRRIPEVERVYLKRIAEAHDHGFSSCPVCEPWEPT
jgi:sec-independent protein translocase protein TatA